MFKKFNFKSFALLVALSATSGVNFQSSPVNFQVRSEMPPLSPVHTVFVEDVVRKYVQQACQEAGLNLQFEPNIGRLKHCGFAMGTAIILGVFIPVYAFGAGVIMGTVGKWLESLGTIVTILALALFLYFIVTSMSFSSRLNCWFYKREARAAKLKFHQALKSGMVNCLRELFDLAQQGCNVTAKSPVLQALLVDQALCTDVPADLKSAAFVERLRMLCSNTELGAAVAEIFKIQSA